MGAPVVTPWRTPLSGFGPVGFDGHAPAAAVPALTPPEFRRDGLEIERQAGRHAVEDGDERFSVRLAGSEKSQHRSVILTEKIARPGRAAASREPSLLNNSHDRA